jgi:dipeptidyl aminopeptidase/acylaminoacyl peptidase
MYPEVAPLGANARSSALLVESYDAPPRLCVLENGELHELRSFASAVVSEQTEPLVAFEQCRWQAPDGLEIHGWLLRPKTAKGPLPLILDVHGGPVWAHRPRYVGKVSLWWTWLAKGYAVLQPNPRGSSGRGQDYARRVFGDMGGADTYDYLSGIDALIERGIADPKRIGVTGGSYGGFMSSWLITQDQRFAAAAPVAPVTNWVSEHLTCHIPHFCAQFLADDMTTPGGKYFTRSPVMFAKRVKTPTLNVCGALDRNTPPGQAVEFHHALRLNGVESVLVTYPEEGHGVRRMPASFDYAARVVGWFMRHMPPPGARDGTDEGNRSPRS